MPQTAELPQDRTVTATEAATPPSGRIVALPVTWLPVLDFTGYGVHQEFGQNLLLWQVASVVRK